MEFKTRCKSFVLEKFEIYFFFFFLLKSKVLDFDVLSNSLKLKLLFYILIRPILTYGSEIWISGFIIKDKTLDTLPFEKIHNRFCTRSSQKVIKFCI